jgi:hypothetical protein
MEAVRVLDDRTGAAPYELTLKGDGKHVADLEAVRLGPCVYVRYQLTAEERESIAKGGDVLLSVLTGDQPFNPVYLGVLVPGMPVGMGDIVQITNALMGQTPE